MHITGLCSPVKQRNIYKTSPFIALLSGAIRPVRSSCPAVPGDTEAQEGTDWLEMLWSLAVSLVAPDEEEEGIHQLTETLTCKKTSPHS